jgi:hypothetical protein
MKLYSTNILVITSQWLKSCHFNGRKATSKDWSNELLEDLKRSKDEKTGLDRQTETFRPFFWRPAYHDVLAALGTNSNAHGFVKDAYQMPIEAAEAKLKDSKGGLDRQREVDVIGIIAMLRYFFLLFFAIITMSRRTKSSRPYPYGSGYSKLKSLKWSRARIFDAQGILSTENWPMPT